MTIPETCAAILLQAMRITAAGDWCVFCEYSGHVDWFTVRWREVHEREFELWEDIDLGDANAAKQLSDIQAELDKLEQAE